VWAAGRTRPHRQHLHLLASIDPHASSAIRTPCSCASLTRQAASVALTAQAATERFLDVAELRPGVITPLDTALDNVLAAAHNVLTGVEALRVAAGAGGAAQGI
jgi:hypothetical protein